MIWTLLACAPVSHGATPDAAPAPAPAVPAPRVEVTPVDADALKKRLFGPSDRVRLVNFWATWCGPCEQEMPTLAAFARSHPEVETIFVDLDLAKLRASKVEPFLAAHGMTGFVQLILDDPDPIGALPKVVPDWPDQVPVTLVIAPDGTISKRWDHSVSASELTIP